MDFSLQALPKLYELGRVPASAGMVQHILDNAAKSIIDELTVEIQVDVHEPIYFLNCFTPTLVFIYEFLYC